MHVSRKILPALVLGIAVTALPASAAVEKRSSFAKYPAADAAEVKKQALGWLKENGAKIDDKALDAIWSGDRPLLDKVTRTLALGDSDAAKLIRDAAED